MMGRQSWAVAAIVAVTASALSAGSIASAVDTRDNTPPSLVGITISPDSTAQGVEVVVTITAVLSDDRIGTNPTNFWLEACKSESTIRPGPNASAERIDRVVDPVTGAAHETWITTMKVPGSAEPGEYLARIEFRDEAENSVTVSTAGPGCRRDSGVPAPKALFTVVASEPDPGPGPDPAPDPDPGDDGKDWKPTQITPTKYPLKWSRATLEDKVKLDEFGRRPIVDRETRKFLLACERDIQLDCIESVGLVDRTGTYAPGSLIRGATFDVTHRVNEGIAPYAEHHTIWDVPGLVMEGHDANLEIVMSVGGTGIASVPGMNMGLNVSGVPLQPSTPSDPYGCRFVDTPGACVKEPTFPEGTMLRFVVRTSWLAPSAISVRGRDVSVGIEDLGTGARRVSITGSPILLQSQGGRAEIEAGRPGWVASTFDFTMYDPRVDRTPGGECTVRNPILISNNAQNSSLPTWDSRKGRLDLRMSAPHFWADGEREWRGYYETSISGVTAKCLWGVDPRVTSYLDLAVYSEDGEEKAATTAIGFKNGVVTIRAYDFTFSTNTVSAKVKVKAGRPCFSKGAQIGNLTCTKQGKRLVWVKR
jgi:hypothetical protein